MSIVLLGQLPDGRIVNLVTDRVESDPFTGECPRWCVREHGTVSLFPEDRSHASEQYDIPLRLEGVVQFDGDTYAFQTARLSLRQNDREREATIAVSQSDTPVWRQITLAEAEAIGLGLLKLVERARTAPSPR